MAVPGGQAGQGPEAYTSFEAANEARISLKRTGQEGDQGVGQGQRDR